MKVVIICMLLVLVSHEIFADKVGCRNVACPKPEPCPMDSYPKPLVKHLPAHIPHHLRSSAGDVRRERDIVFSTLQRESIKIIPTTYDHHYQKRSIIDDDILIQYCCPSYECICKPNYCDQECPPNEIPVNTTAPTDPNDLPYGVPGNCCMPCRKSYCITNTFRKHGQKWRSDDCTTCECHYGEVKCQQSYCQPPDCLNYELIPGECCPVCVNDSTNFCRDIKYCSIECQYGYRQQGNCDLCECTRPTTIGTGLVNTNINDTVTKDNITGPYQQHSNNSSHVYNVQFWIIMLLSLGSGLALTLITVWCCHFHKNAKYSIVQIA
ncbi:cysteine-rich motor neuron 1 protein-like isoform X1 [Topomyia yanbarensis]|uniref:cysteine-rich motor neuron 1 protein-like isoform X1 n=1 Tax=Topomyia yanbarensis TaxID=2498891 RepID=UPI00273AF200|nr:cysteine-rich motor neuron 1 protein-like isoform X1 [Topomyia yanbarensis]XP_058838034.1 cysteine-rich motor neuron 1 protein-like isoform X1 [Topomyia yanbarensis]XP_058838035.1 cysteine-rich motor neuron 1 protein-like isoform X1 [Topomyia yanbarensis]XP_058838036.1 cysteine-rich motor neuron 1 protein-like isoform X1 [Topomyia yanbarensis]XP_058838038.1 cysteine-rich motor neuron 1 protein-like isoform X1 [Topomyia yanbarensis]XP_058838039.1 cysteine-rich motor neuron 1 protein-like iso